MYAILRVIVTLTRKKRRFALPQVRFILAVVEGRLKVNNRKKADLLAELKSEGYDIFLPP